MKISDVSFVIQTFTCQFDVGKFLYLSLLSS